MALREELREELLQLIKHNKEGFSSGTPESKQINALIDELSCLTLYPNAISYGDIYKGHWVGDYFNFGSAVGGDGAKNQGTGVTTSLRVFSMGRLPDIPATHVSSALEIDPLKGIYNFYSSLKIGKQQIPSHHFTYGRFSKKEENLNRFFVEFDGFEIRPKNPSTSLQDYCKEIAVNDEDQLQAVLSPSPKLWSDIVYMDDTLRIQLGQLGGHYIMVKTDLPMYSITHSEVHKD